MLIFFIIKIWIILLAYTSGEKQTLHEKKIYFGCSELESWKVKEDECGSIPLLQYFKKMRIMKWYYTLFLLFNLCFITSGQNEIVISDSDLQGGNTYTWLSTNTYILDGWVFLEEGGTLIIEAGTVIKALEEPSLPNPQGYISSGLIIARGASIRAEGKAGQPIIFTSIMDDLSTYDDLTYTDRALWGGLVVLGDAPVGSAAVPYFMNTFGDARTQFGGENSGGSSGTLSYISIRHCGIPIIEFEELNGLSLAGVGGQTRVDHIEVFASDDDGIAVIGGNVNLKYISSSFNGDDAFDYDLGWRGYGQFWFGINAKDTQGFGGEFDGAKPDEFPYFSQPVIYNVTLIGQGVEAFSSPNQIDNHVGTFFRDGAGGTLANNIFTEFPGRAIEVEDRDASYAVDARTRMEAGELELLNNIWWSFGNGATWDTGEDGLIRVRSDAEDMEAQFLVDHLLQKENVLVDPELYTLDWSNSGLLDPRPAPDGPAYENLAAYPSFNFFEEVNFKGAFGEDANWIQGWTALDQYEMVDDGVFETSSTTAASLNSLNWSIFPNPVGDFLTVNIDETNAPFTLSIFNTAGQMMRQWEINTSAQQQFNVSDLPEGAYQLMLQNNTSIDHLTFIKL